jgi:phage terminase large subunit-like protein
VSEEHYYYDAASADLVKDFLGICRQTKGQWGGLPLTLIPWQVEFIDQFFGQKSRDSGLRRYRHASIWVPRRNGKTSLLAGISLLLLLMDNEPGASVFIIANTVKQADNLFDTCLGMVQQSAALSKRCECIASDFTIKHHASRSKLTVLSSDLNALPGVNASALIFDELAFFTDRRLYTNLRPALLNRRQPVTITISTASDNLEGIGKEQFDLAVNVKTGVVSVPDFLPVIYQAPLDLDWRSAEAWRAANPSLGYTVKLCDLAELCEEAKAVPTKESEFKQFHLNWWQNSALAWIPVDTRNGCGQPFREEELHGCSAVIGLDLARRFDMASYVLWIEKDGLHYLLPRYFMPEELPQRKTIADGVNYREWARQGHLTLTPGDVIDYGFIRESIKSDSKLFTIDEIAYDPWQAEVLCRQQLSDEDGFNVIEVRQGLHSMGPPSREFYRLLLDKKIRHGGHPILRWNAANVVVRTDLNLNIMPDKKNSKSSIDGIVSSIIACSRVVTSFDEWNKWAQEHSGPTVLVSEAKSKSA